MMKNRNGQVLVLFVLILPLVFLIIALVVDQGLLYIEKRKMDQMVKEMVHYAFQHEALEESEKKENIRTLLRKNINALDQIEIIFTDRVVRIKITKVYRSLFFQKGYTLVSHYRGKLEQDQLKISRE